MCNQKESKAILNPKVYNIRNRIMPHAFIGPKVKMGVDNYIGHGTYIMGNVTIGNGNIIGPYVVIGTPAEHTRANLHFDEIEGKIEIGDKNIIREFVTIHHPEIDDPKTDITRIHNNVFLMCHSHVGHDAELFNDVVCSPYAAIGGYAKVLRGSYIGMKATLHQNTTIGESCMVGMGAVVVKDVPPFLAVAGNPAKFLRCAKIRMERNGFSKEDIMQVKDISWESRAQIGLSNIRRAYDDFEQLRNKKRKVLRR